MRLSLDRRLQLIAFLAGVPALILTLIFALQSPRDLGILGMALGAVLALVAGAHSIRVRMERPLQTLSNLLAALREGDFSFRAKQAHPGDPMGEVYAEINSLSELLQDQRLKALEATALLRSVMAETDVAILAFDEGLRLKLINRAGENLLSQPRARLLGTRAEDLRLATALSGEGRQVLDLAFPGRSGRFEIHRSTFRQAGRPHQLLVLSDLTRAMREEERTAWQRLIRVLGHEINNSLAPIQSLSASLLRTLDQRADGWEEDIRQGLGIVSSRALSLNRFMEAYTRIAKLPEPHKTRIDLGSVVRRTVALVERVPVRVLDSPDLEVMADEDQLGQALINLLRNAADAALETGGGVSIGWSETDNRIEIRIEDDGPGLPSQANLFVPFFTTKPEGSGVGLILSRQIAEAHGGSLHLHNRSPRGAVAMLHLPRQLPAPAVTP